MLDFPEKAKNGKDILVWFAEFYEETTGQRVPDSHWKRGAGFIKRMKKDYTINEIKTIVWYVCNIKPNTRSIFYCNYFFDKLGAALDLKKKYYKKKSKKEKEVKYEEVKEKLIKKGDGILDEFF